MEIIGNNILFNDDCFKIMEQLSSQDVKVDAIITDPPYDIVNTNGGTGSKLVKTINASLSKLDDDNISSVIILKNLEN